MSDSEQIIYFHGLPGSTDELLAFGPDIARRSAGFRVIDRSGARTAPSATDYFAQLAADLRRDVPDARLRLIGFSLGASAALRTAAHLGDQVSHIDLVSAAAPLDLGTYLPDMAGAPVFRTARDNPQMFHVLTRAQSLLARFWPGQLHAMLFATARGDDGPLASDPEFKAALKSVLRQCLGPGRAGYLQEIGLYAQDWRAELDRVTAPVWLFHGEEDNWSPVAMARDLTQRLPRCEALELLPGGSHYSTLKWYLSNL